MQSNIYIARFLEILDCLSLKGKRVPGLIMSSPGSGKTTTIELWAKYKDYNFNVLIPSRYAPDDILGLQSLVNNNLVRLSPVWYQRLVKQAENNKRNILFIDEISACDTYIQGPLFDLIFNYSLGEYKLPDNTLIIAAGNYSKDLNNEFHLTAPLINRFMILNLMDEDYDIKELLYDTLANSKDINSYLGLSYNKSDYNIQKIKDWIINSGEIIYGHSSWEEITGYGLLGITSNRSIYYTFLFIEEYIKKYNDDLWIRIAGDSLGVSIKREGKPLRDILATFKEDFKGPSLDKRSISDICNELAKNYSYDLLKILIDKATGTKLEEYSAKDISSLTKALTTLKDIPEAKKACTLIVNHLKKDNK